MDENFQKRVQRLFAKRTKLENELYKCHEIIIEHIESQSRSSKIDTQIQNCKSLIETAVEINEELIKLVSKSVDPDKLIPAQDMWLHTVTSRNDTVLQKAASYKAGLNVEPEETELDKVAESLSTIVTTQPQDSHEADARSKVSRYSSRHHKSGSHKSSRYTVAQSKTSTEKRRDLLVLKKQQEEPERQAKVSLKLKAQQKKIKEQQGSLELEELAEVHRKKLAEIELKEFELEEELSEASEKIGNACVTHVDPQRTEQWVENVVTEQEQAEFVASSEQSHPVVESSPLIATDVLQGVGAVVSGGAVVNAGQTTWNHVLSGDNPADTGTRGISSEALKDSSWVRGPSILRTCDWPFKPNTDVIKKIQLKGPLCDIDTCLETASTFVVDASSEKAPSIRLFKNWDKFSSIVKYKRVLAFMLRVLPSHKHFRTKTLEITDPSELDIAEQKLIYLAQSESFPAEVKILQSDKLITKKSRIAKYSPFIGPAGILRSTGRISRLVDTDFDSKHPIILDGRHRVAHMLIRHMHFQHAHQGLDYMRAVVQLKYIVLKMRWLLGNIENTCITCRKRKAKTVVPIMSDLPIERLGYKQPPFSNTGVDYFGPFQVPIRRSTEKRWGFLFTCLTTRLEQFTSSWFHLSILVAASWA